MKFRHLTSFLCPAAVLYQGIVITMTMVYGYVYVTGKLFQNLTPGLWVLGTVFIPGVIYLTIKTIAPGNRDKVAFGNLPQYVIRKGTLYCEFFGIPTFKFRLADAEKIEAWYLLGPGAHGSKENNLYYFWSGLWFWPYPADYVLKKLFALQIQRYEYIVKMKNGWCIIIGCSNKFANEINRAMLREKAKQSLEKGLSSSEILSEAECR